MRMSYPLNRRSSLFLLSHLFAIIANDLNLQALALSKEKPNVDQPGLQVRPLVTPSSVRNDIEATDLIVSANGH